MIHTKLLIQNLSKTFRTNGKKVDALSSISLHINSGEFVSVIGPSGCGKSTLCDIIAGIEKPTRGDIFLDKEVAMQNLTSNQTETGIASLQGKFGYMIQNPLLLPWRNVLQNIVLGADILGLPKKQAMQTATEMLHQFGLSEFAASYPYMLSGGMKQRIALLRTILFHKDFLLLDEPFGALDALTRLDCQIWLLKLWETYHSTILFVTHDIREAIFLSDRMYVLSDRPGKIIGELRVDFSRPRKKEFLTGRHAIALEKKLLQLLVK